MKSIAVLTMAATAVAASQLRGPEEGIEEVSDQIEHFPAEEIYIDRRMLIEDEDGNVLADSHDEMAERLMEEYFADEDGDDFPVDVEEGDYEFQGSEVWEPEDDESLWPADGPDVMIIGTEIHEDDEEYENHEFYWEEDDEQPEEGKVYSPEEGYSTLEGNSLLGGDDEVVEFDSFERNLAACGANQAEVKILMKTDNYAYETSWKIIDASKNNKVVAQGPPPGTNYADARTYSGRWCLPPGRYIARVNDKGRDGMCTGNASIYGCGYFKVFMNGRNVGQVVNDKSRWTSKQFSMNVAPMSSRIDGTSTQSSGSQWCKKVRSVMKVPSGTCTLSNGQRGHRVRVLTKTDKYGKESQWSITRNGVVRMKMGPIVPANSQKVVEQCLPPGDYEFKIQDPDGMCCRHGQGKYQVWVDGKPMVDGGSFIKSESHKFRAGYDWISTMNERDCEWWWAHDYRRRDWHTRCYRGASGYCNKSYRHLKWSATLKADAAVYARKLLNTCDDTGIKHDVTEQGENLAKNKGSGKWGALYPADKVTKRFVDNEEFWGWNANAHLTQALWYPTRYIGCAESAKSMGGGKMCRMQVCRYAKAGNCMMGKYNSSNGNNWMIPMMMDDSPCGPMCPRGGCHN